MVCAEHSLACSPRRTRHRGTGRLNHGEQETSDGHAVSSSQRRDAFPLYTRDEDLEERMATEHARAERLLGAALAEQHRSRERYDAAVGRSAHLLAAVGLHAADQEVAARDAWRRWVDDDGCRGLNAGPFELLVADSGP